MNDPPTVSPPLGIEAVEWLSEGGENLTVRVTGRWRRRRPTWNAQPTLVIEGQGRKYRFPAMPEPPSLTGVPPGMWRISFAVPAALAPDLGGQAWLQFGAVVVPLPTVVEPVSAATEPPASSQPEVRPDRADQAVARLSVRAEALEGELAHARTELGRISASLQAEQRARRTAEQQAHSERAQRLDLTRRLDGRARDAERARQALGDLAAAEARAREIESELAAARRQIDETEHVAAAAAAARDRAQARAAEVGEEVERLGSGNRAPIDPRLDRLLRVERDLIASQSDSAARIPREPPSPIAAMRREAAAADGRDGSGSAAALGERDPLTAQALDSALRAELDLRTRSEAALRAQVVDSQARLVARDLLERRTASTLGQLREQLDGLRDALTHERNERRVAEGRAVVLETEVERLRRRTQEAHAAIAELRRVLGSLPQPVVEAHHDAEVKGQGAVDTETRLSEALVRLRAAIAPLQPRPEQSPSAPKARADRRVVRGDTWRRVAVRAVATVRGWVGRARSGRHLRA